MRKTPAVQVGPNHRRGIATTLTFLDEALCEFEQWAKGREVRSVLYEERNTLTPKQRRRLLTEIAEIRPLLRELKGGLGLDAAMHSAEQSIWARCSGLREHLVELEGKHLRRYGEPAAGLADYLDPRVEQLLGRIDRMSTIVSPPQAHTDSD
jgi:hypothetical protein